MKNELEWNHMSQSGHFSNIRVFDMWRSPIKVKWLCHFTSTMCLTTFSAASVHHLVLSANLTFTIVCFDFWTALNNNFSKVCDFWFRSYSMSVHGITVVCLLATVWVQWKLINTKFLGFQILLYGNRTFCYQDKI